MERYGFGDNDGDAYSSPKIAKKANVAPEVIHDMLGNAMPPLRRKNSTPR
jgi:hypothetical protein